ncbi:isocitrate lyase/PEP mutase family protein [Amycolatopsis suaedae]|uniref:Isocitrate lyase/phosphoenolpyruvate mutase family protein n=1 Tax=Amycolatopsis suaedae TaxID=2510978 RepID=A0A4Q7J7D2_9PSEU|nr:isocitrate lyase/phosphoenolpyruvate mutase family protein [Amycolatopsis suaedae]RZQ61934.1 isocitrate lyase/phosphoenolpyruvate mutase family protein [Amycolatopsis suaedae]
MGSPAAAAALRSFHSEDAPLVLPNAWDALSALLAVRAGARAVGTTSAGVAWALGYQDGALASDPNTRPGRDVVIEAVARIARVVDVPVTADIEDGYGPDPADVAATVERVVGAGAVGINLEDTTFRHDALLDPAAFAGRLRAAREAAERAGLTGLVVNARTDVFLVGGGNLDEAVERGRVYAEAGADCLFVPGLLNLDALATLTAAVPLPVNAMAVPGGPTVGEFAAAGVRRVSVGSAIQQAAYAAARACTGELLTSGTYTTFADALDLREISTLLPT